MIRSIFAFFCAVLIAAAAQARELPGSFADLVEKLSPAVVNISSTQKVKGAQGFFGMPFQDLPNTPEMEPFREFFERFGQQQDGNRDDQPEREVYSLGSGFIIDASGIIITNNHVVDGADDVTVTLTDNTKYKATVLGRDKKTDLALLKVDAKKSLPFVTLGDSDAMRVGDWVIAIGNPFGLGGSVTQGIISARQRSINAGPFDDFLQTDAPINRGNSGGPLFNTQGEVIGINTAIFSPSGGNIGIGFAVPTALAKPVIEQLKQYGRTHRGWLGVKIQEVSEEIADSMGLSKAMGALVIEVSKGSPADKAGVQAGDIITGFDGRDISEMRFLPRMVAETKIGKTASLTLWRKGKTMTVAVTLGELDESEDATVGKHKDGAKKSKPKAEFTEVLGLQLATLTPRLREEYGVDTKQEGVIVLEVGKGSEARKRDFREGDVVLEVNGEPVRTPEEFKNLVDGANQAGRKFALVKLAREKDIAFVTLPSGEGEKKTLPKP